MQYNRLVCAIHLAALPFFMSAASASESFSINSTVSGSDVVVTLTPSAEQDGQGGNYYVAFTDPSGKLFFSNGSTWLQFSSGQEPTPHYRGTLSRSQFKMTNINQPTTLSGYVLYAGYGASLSDMISRGTYGVAYKVPSSTGNLKTLDTVEFSNMQAPTTDLQRSSAYTTSTSTAFYKDGSVQTKSLAYRTLYNNTDEFNGAKAGYLYNKNGEVIKDTDGNPFVAETPDANSLFNPIANAAVSPMGGNPLSLVTHFEYQWRDNAGNNTETINKQFPMTMKLANVDQNKSNGELNVTDLKNIDFSSVGGLWTPCAGSLSPWNTHLGSEEYEPDARCLVDASYKSAKAFCAFASNTLTPMTTYYGLTNAKVYNYGIVPEVTVSGDGTTSVVKHRVLGRLSREKAQVMPDKRTVYQGDDGTYNVVTMFVADAEQDLSAGTLYAAKFTQTSSVNGGEGSLTWVKLGHATDSELATQADSLSFSDIFETAEVVEIKDTAGKVTGYQPAPTGFVQIIAGQSSGTVENLKVKAGKEQAAAFLETRRYAAYMGATTEWEKYEGVAVNTKDKKSYHAITRMRSGMEKGTLPVDHIQLARNSAGAVYEMPMTSGIKDSTGTAISSDWVGTLMKALVVGEDITKDAVGNICHVDKICSPDNLSFSEKWRVLFIGEDSSSGHINNFVWAYHVDADNGKGKLSRILSVPTGAENTGLQVQDNVNGFSYIMSNYQHAGDFSSNINTDLKTRLTPLIDSRKAGVGYIGNLPKLN